MILRVGLFVLLLTGVLGFGVVAWVSIHSRPVALASEAPVQTNVLVIAREVRAGSLLRAEDLEPKALTGTDAPASSFKDTAATRRELIGSMVRRALPVGDVLRSDDIMRPGDHGFLASVLKPGMRAITVGVDAVTGTAGLIWPGDRVDLILTQTLDNQQLAPGQRIAAETILQNALVIAIDQLIVQGAASDGPSPQNPRTVTLEVTSQEAERVQVAERIGRLSLAVRSAEPVAGAATASSPVRPPVWAGDVSHAFSSPPPANAAPVVMRVFQGSADGKEFRY